MPNRERRQSEDVEGGHKRIIRTRVHSCLMIQACDSKGVLILSSDGTCIDPKRKGKSHGINSKSKKTTRTDRTLFQKRKIFQQRRQKKGNSWIGSLPGKTGA